jgi:hypothetical protein
MVKVFGVAIVVGFTACAGPAQDDSTPVAVVAECSEAALNAHSTRLIALASPFKGPCTTVADCGSQASLSAQAGDLGKSCPAGCREQASCTPMALACTDGVCVATIE